MGKALGEELITPTRIYSETIQHLVRDLPIQGLAHITGGGIMDNIIRVIPQACGISIHRDSWERPPIFAFLQAAGNVEEKEMMRTFNNGIGLVAVVPEENTQDVLNRLTGSGEKAWVIGEVTKTRKNARSRVQLT
nr:AIR synthase-related protein [Desulfosarcina cetonica]